MTEEEKKAEKTVEEPKEETTEENEEETVEESEEETVEENPKEKTVDDLLKEKDEQIQEYKDRYLRTKADFDNFQKRSIKEKQEFVKYANEGLVLKILEAYEDLERALEVKDDKDLREGVELIYKKLDKILTDEGVEEIKSEHEIFDPFKHEAMMTQKNDDCENNEIIQVLQKGYTLNSKVIRYAKVIVCKK